MIFFLTAILYRIRYCVFFCLLTHGLSAALPPVLVDELNALLQPIAQKTLLSCWLEDANNNECLYSIAPQVPCVPASVQKLLTTLIALRSFGDSFRWSTTLYESEDKKHLFLECTGDPSLTLKDLQTLFKQLSPKATWESLCIIDSFPTLAEVCPTWMFEDVPSSYASPISGFIVDANRVKVTIYPGREVGSKTYERLSIPYPCVNHAITAIDDTRPQLKLSWNNTSLNINGYIAFGGTPMIESYSSPTVELHALTCLKQVLNSLKLPLTLRYERGSSLPKGISPLATHRSPPLNQSLISALRRSDNVYFDSLFLQLAFKENPTPKDWEDAAESFKAYGQKLIVDLDLKDWQIADGSGLSMKNYVSAENIIALLRIAEKDPVFIASLPTPNSPGTLHKRFDGFKGRICAKTGYMQGTSTLAGFLYLPKGKTWRFVLFVNQAMADRAQNLLLQEKMIELIQKYTS